MDGSASRSTTESGWTLYLDPSTSTSTSTSTLYHQHKHEEEEEDLSMVSDASSGPPIFQEDYDQDSFYGNGSQMKKIKSTDESGTKMRRSCLEDTATSHIFTFSKKNKKPSMEHNVSSEGFSATHLKRKSDLQKHYGFFQAEK